MKPEISCLDSTTAQHLLQAFLAINCLLQLTICAAGYSCLAYEQLRCAYTYLTLLELIVSYDMAGLCW